MGIYFYTNIRQSIRRDTRHLSALINLVLCMSICSSLAYWGTQLIRPKSRIVTAIPQAKAAEISISQAAGLFGGTGELAVTASNFRLMGVVVAKTASQSVVVISVNGKPPQSLRIGKEVLPGTNIREVHATYVVVSEGGILKKIILPEKAQPSADLVNNAPVRSS
ncbi:type II secretion system protein N [Glaciimonas sp. PAMC28666]|uniref:type II secretion system protein N n=1 Tax=Glaciimonas sp. PAMC28666 TaxID=2807626 RepID=UPI0019624051|nr:type II secretion system protein N [Glaciimonas sp. PAMC28666]QRX82378.1 hypothetical protein JQN73_20200 [Glaciimonas sp. PAMC28666]